MKFSGMILMLILTMFSSSLIAQDTEKQQEKAAVQQPAKMRYSCPMHPSVNSSKAGKCAKCGMELVKSAVEQKKTYVCPMHPDITSRKPGKCVKCKMALKEQE